MVGSSPKILHLFAGAGGGALGFKQAGFECVGAFDNEPLAVEAFEYLTGDKATQADLGAMSPQGLREACTGRPDVVLSSPPCKAFSGCLPAAVAATDKYQEMSNLALRGIWLALEAWETPPAIVLLENVPRILSRGKEWMDRIIALFHAYGYAVTPSVHDAGELGGLAQRRKRLLLCARHMKQVPSFVFVPPKQRLRGVGEVLGGLPVPLPVSKDGGPMHRLPRMSAMNWLRLALIPAGGDWRDLPEAVAIHAHKDRQNGGMGVNGWEQPGHTVLAEGSVRNTWASVQDPRLHTDQRNDTYGVCNWKGPGSTVLAAANPDNGRFSIADPRVNAGAHQHNGRLGVEDGEGPAHAVVGRTDARTTWGSVADPRIAGSEHRHNGKYGVEDWAEPSHAVIAEARTGKAWAGVADPRMQSGGENTHSGALGVSDWEEPSPTVIGAPRVMSAPISVADPRLPKERREGSVGVTDWDAASTPIIARTRDIHNGPWSVADPRIDAGPHRHHGGLGVTDWDYPAKTVVGAADPRQKPVSVADPRLEHEPRKGSFGVLGWAEPSHVIRAVQKPQNTADAVADPRIEWEIVGDPLDLESKRPCYVIIRAIDGTWHRPMTTLELAALQGCPTKINGEWLCFPGNDQERRALIGNMIPPPTARAIGRVVADALNAARDGTTFRLSSDDVWVRREELSA